MQVKATHWWPDPITGITETHRDTNEVRFTQTFAWTPENLDVFKSIDADYQWELRRPSNPDVWDYITSDCTKMYYWTNLPDANDFWSEESQLPLLSPCGLSRGDEEFEIKSHDQEALQANFNYTVVVSFSRKILDTLISVQTKSEYCGDDWPFCETFPGPPIGEWRKCVKEIAGVCVLSAKFDYKTMELKNVNS